MLMASATTKPVQHSALGHASSKQARYARRKAASDAEIGPIPPVQDRRARLYGRWDPLFFAMNYFPNGLGQACLSLDHCLVIDTMAACFRDGGQYAQAIFRGFTKTTTAEVMVLWCMLYGFRHFLAWIGAEDEIASESVDAIKKECEENDRLYADFPEIMHPIRHLDGKHQRCESQTYRGQKTRSKLVKGQLIFPTIRLSPQDAERIGVDVDRRGYTPNSCARLDAFGILSFKRGRKHNRGDGRIQRIDGTVIDDFQTDISAGQPKDTARRLGVIRKSILRSGGHRESMACVCNGTIINPGDGMEQIMNRELFPKFRSRKVPMLKSRASESAEKWWFGEYARRLKDWRNDDTNDEARLAAQAHATALYREHQVEMDSGAVATWHNAYSADDGEISAIQHAYNILILEGEDVFASECQQNPKRAEDSADELKLEHIIGQSIEALPRGLVPIWANTLTAFIDVQERALYWLITAWGSGFRGHVVDYGIYPEQLSGSLAYGGVKKSLRQMFPGRGQEGAMRAALNALEEQILGREFQRQDDGVRMSVVRMLKDSSDFTEQIYAQIRDSLRRDIQFPSKGRYVNPAHTQWPDFVEKPGEELNREYRFVVKPTEGSKTLRVMQYDTNWWKSFVYARLGTAIGDPGSLSLPGHPRDNTQLAAHILAEYRVRTKTATGKPVDEWRPRPGQSDNHLLDCLVGTAVAAAKAGVRLEALPSQPTERRVANIPAHMRGGRHGR